MTSAKSTWRNLTKEEKRDVVVVALFWSVPAFLTGGVFGAVLMWVVMK